MILRYNDRVSVKVIVQETELKPMFVDGKVTVVTKRPWWAFWAPKETYDYSHFHNIPIEKQRLLDGNTFGLVCEFGWDKKMEPFGDVKKPAVRIPADVETAIVILEALQRGTTIDGGRPSDILRAALEAPPRDKYHTMKELYEHRRGLFCALARYNLSAWKSRRHADGELCFGGDGSFVAGLHLATTGELITYHLPERWWGRCLAKELNTAPEWDGHTSEDVLDRLKSETEI